MHLDAALAVPAAAGDGDKLQQCVGDVGSLYGLIACMHKPWTQSLQDRRCKSCTTHTNTDAVYAAHVPLQTNHQNCQQQKPMFVIVGIQYFADHWRRASVRTLLEVSYWLSNACLTTPPLPPLRSLPAPLVLPPA